MPRADRLGVKSKGGPAYLAKCELCFPTASGLLAPPWSRLLSTSQAGSPRGVCGEAGSLAPGVQGRCLRARRFAPGQATGRGVVGGMKTKIHLQKYVLPGPHGGSKACRFTLMNTPGKYREKILKCFRNKALNKSIKFIYKPIKWFND